MGIKYEVSAITGKYEQDGVEKNRYTRMGVVMTTKNGGLMLKVEAIPLNWDGMAYLNEPKARDGDAPRQAAQTRPAQQRTAQTQPAAADDGFDDTVPF